MARLRAARSPRPRTAIMNLQVLEALGIEKAFALGTSQGGFIVTRMALLDPDKVS